MSEETEEENFRATEERRSYLIGTPRKELTRDDLEDLCSMLYSDITGLVAEARRVGEHLRGEVFIPEYLGFEETRHEAAGGQMSSIYTKAGYNITRLKENIWLFLNPKSQKIEIKMDNMLQAIMVLSALGVPVSVETITQDKTADEQFQKYLNEDATEQLTGSAD